VSITLPLSPGDWARYRAIRLRALSRDPDAFGSLHADEVTQPEAHWRARLVRAHSTILASLGGEDVGLVVVADWWEVGVDAVGLYSMWVAPEARGQRVGDALLQSAIDVARSKGKAMLLLEVGDFNAPARALYERNGFTPTGRTTTMDPPRAHIAELEYALSLGPKAPG